MFKSAIEKLTQNTGRSPASLKQPDFFSDDGFDYSTSWNYSVNAAEQQRKLLDLEVGSFNT